MAASELRRLVDEAETLRSATRKDLEGELELMNNRRDEINEQINALMELETDISETTEKLDFEAGVFTKGGC